MFDKKEYMKRYNKKWLEDNPTYHKQWEMDNKEHRRKQKKQWEKDSKEHRNEYMKQYHKNNPKYVRRYLKTEKGKIAAQRSQSNRRAELRKIINTLIPQEWLDILKEYKYKCAYCGRGFNLFNRPEKDHVIPISKGGDNTKENIVPACKSCNSKKGNKIL